MEIKVNITYKNDRLKKLADIITDEDTLEQLAEYANR